MLYKCSILNDGRISWTFRSCWKQGRDLMAPSKGGIQAYSSAFSWEQCFTAHGEYLLSCLTPSPVGGEGEGKVGAVTHMLWWRVWKFREISDCPRVTTMMNDGSGTGQTPGPLNQELPSLSLSSSPAPSFLWVRADALEELPEPRKEPKSLPYFSSLHFNPSSKIQQFLPNKAPLKDYRNSNCVHSPQPLHVANYLTSILHNDQLPMLSDQWSVTLLGWLRVQNLLSKRPRDGSTKNQLPFSWPSLDE